MPPKDTDSSATKFDEGKAPYHLIPPEFLEAICAILAFGASKYAERNWEQGMAWSRCFSACMRHMWCWWGSKGPTSNSFLFGSMDPETGYSHLWHAACCLVFLVTYEERNIGEDDRHV